MPKRKEPETYITVSSTYYKKVPKIYAVVRKTSTGEVLHKVEMTLEAAKTLSVNLIQSTVLVYDQEQEGAHEA